MQFRFATINDLPVIVDIYNSTIPSNLTTADTEFVTVNDKLIWFNEHNSLKRPLWIVEINNCIIGWISLQDFYGRPAYNGTAEISIYLEENYRNKGFGKKMLSFTIEQCNKLDIHTLLAFIFQQNEASIRLFKSAGFEDWALLKEVALLNSTFANLIILGKKVTQ